MAKIISFSTVFPCYHKRKGDATYFVEKFLKSNKIEYNYCVHEHSLHSFWSLNRGKEELVEDFISFNFHDPFYYEPKNHTIRAGKRFKAGEYFSPRIWSGRPYFSKTITIAPDTLIVKTYDFEIKDGLIYINNQLYAYSSSTEQLDILAKNDGLSQIDLLDWFKYPKNFSGQVIIWSNEVNY